MGTWRVLFLEMVEERGFGGGSLLCGSFCGEE